MRILLNYCFFSTVFVLIIVGALYAWFNLIRDEGRNIVPIALLALPLSWVTNALILLLAPFVKVIEHMLVHADMQYLQAVSFASVILVLWLRREEFK